jgi:2-oxoglutarate dehydrogenase E2 component (dihydrolipoamide succinyltransferase)
MKGKVMAVELKVPSVGESITEVFIGTWLKKPGDSVQRDEPVVEIETDKAALEIPSPVTGTLLSTSVAVGDAANVGDVIALIEEGAAAEVPAAEPAEPAGAAPAQVPAAQAPAPAAEARVMPAAAKALAEQQLSAADLQATGPGGRLLKEDVQRHAVAVATEPEAAAAQGERLEEVVPMSRMRRVIARRLVESQQNAAILTTFNEVDMSGVMNLRKQYQPEFEKRYGVRLGFMSFFVKAAIEALRQYPAVNAEIRGDDVIYKNYYDIGVAVSTERGLLVPVVRDAERLSFAQIEQAIGDFGRRAQENLILPDELQGGTFTISNGGVFGSLLSTPIINPPQTGVLGMHTIQQRPVAIDGKVEIRPMMYLALSYDHRLIDGREAVSFLKHIADAVGNPARILLEI